ncbi:uncharacterized protein LOC134179885 [Corticium candelabrum]|uniref:uncharacterized protein LOC134179885 n=1 Tax=Corticium candelabrum TaxID=121492 RepID=UPI002E26A995|nr:uncharacterized protein LOC134179885 [Corticium candelabrum]
MRDSFRCVSKSNQYSKCSTSLPVRQQQTQPHRSPFARRATHPVSPLACSLQAANDKTTPKLGSPMVVRRESACSSFWGSSVKQRKAPRPPSPVPARRNRSNAPLMTPHLERLDEYESELADDEDGILQPIASSFEQNRIQETKMSKQQA